MSQNEDEAYDSIMSAAERSRAFGEPESRIKRDKQQRAARWLDSSRVAERSSAQAEESRQAEESSRAEGGKRFKEEERRSSTAATEQPTEVVRSYHFCDNSWVRPLRLLRLCPEQFPLGDVSAPIETYTIEPAKTIQYGRGTVTSTRTAGPTAWTIIEKPVTSRTTASPTTWITVEKPTTSTKTISPTSWTTTEVPVTETVTSTISEYVTTLVKETGLTQTVYSPVVTVTKVPITETVTLSSTLTEVEIVTETLTSTAHVSALDDQGYTRLYGGSGATACPPAGLRAQFQIWQNDHPVALVVSYVFLISLFYILCWDCCVGCCGLMRRAYIELYTNNSDDDTDNIFAADDIDEADNNNKAAEKGDADNNSNDAGNAAGTDIDTDTDSNNDTGPKDRSSSRGSGKTNQGSKASGGFALPSVGKISDTRDIASRRSATEGTHTTNKPSSDSETERRRRLFEKRDPKQPRNRTKSIEDLSGAGESDKPKLEDVTKEDHAEQVVQGAVIGEASSKDPSVSPRVLLKKGNAAAMIWKRRQWKPDQSANQWSQTTKLSLLARKAG